MFPVLIGFVFILVGLQAMFRRRAVTASTGGQMTMANMVSGLLGNFVFGLVLVLLGLLFLASTSFVLISADRVGHLKRVYMASDLPPGRIIALPGQKGPQAEVLGPGFHFRPLLNVLFDVEQYDIVQVPEGFYGQVTTQDG
ncbi:MAG: hypothetical protein GYA66_07345, partial [Phyllobacteriaceae bacterium]|nr:hypothetical protein [Phyllobacteriaceae bacterium]